MERESTLRDTRELHVGLVLGQIPASHLLLVEANLPSREERGNLSGRSPPSGLTEALAFGLKANFHVFNVIFGLMVRLQKPISPVVWGTMGAR